MPIRKNWSEATVGHVKANVPEKGGIYELKSFGELTYIGKSDNLRNRLLIHLSDKEPNAYRFETTSGWWIFGESPKQLEDEHLTAYGNTDEILPPWNSNDTRG